MKVKEVLLNLIFDDRGYVAEVVELTGYLEFIQFRKQIESVGHPIVKVTSKKLINPILDTTLSKSDVFPVRMLCCNTKGEAIAELSYEFSKIPLNDQLKVELLNGTPKTKIEVLIRYAGTDN